MKKRPLVFTLVVLFGITLNSQKAINPLLDSLSKLMENERIPGLMICIVNSDSILYTGGLGYADVGEKEEVTSEHLFRLGSISKGFTSLGLLKLQEEQLISLKDPILEIDPKLPVKNKWEDSSPIKVEHLLEHTAGFDDMHFYAAHNRKDTLEPWCSEMVLSHRKALVARWEPGTKFSYSNPGYVVAGHIIEKVTRRRYVEYLEEEILRPIGMDECTFFFKEPRGRKMAKGYYHEGGEFKEMDWASIQGGPAGAICMNAKDAARYLQFVLKKGNGFPDIISEDAFDRFENAKTTLAAKEGMPGGYGLGNSNSWNYGHLFHGHGGGIEGFSSLYRYSRSADIGVMISMNSNKNTRNIMNSILDYFLSENAPPVNRKLAPISREMKEKYEGYYDFKSPRNQLFAFIEEMGNGVSLIFDDDKVLVDDILGNRKDTLYHAGDDQFYSRNEGIPFALLKEGEERKKILWLANEYAEKGSLAIRWTKNVVYAISFLMVILFLIFGFFSLLSVNKKGEGSENRKFWVIWYACLSFILIPTSFGISMNLMRGGGPINFGSIFLFANTILFYGLVFISTLRSLELGKTSWFFKNFYRVTTYSLIVLSLLLLTNGFFAFRLWAY